MYRRQQSIIDKKEGQVNDVEQQSCQMELEEAGVTVSSTLAVESVSLHNTLSKEQWREPSRDGSQIGLVRPR